MKVIYARISNLLGALKLMSCITAADVSKATHKLYTNIKFIHLKQILEAK